MAIQKCSILAIPLYLAAAFAAAFAAMPCCAAGNPSNTSLASSRQTPVVYTIPGSPNWQMFSSPYGYNSTFTSLGIFAAAWSSSDDQYAVSPALRADNPVPGHGYWVYTAQPDPINNVAKLVDTSQPFLLFLDAGWNQVGNPFLQPMLLSNITVAGSGGQPVPFSNAQAAGTVSSLFAFDTVKNQYVTLSDNNQSLDVWAGAWIYSPAPVTLVIQPPGSGSSTGTTYANALFSSSQFKALQFTAYVSKPTFAEGEGTYVGFYVTNTDDRSLIVGTGYSDLKVYSGQTLVWQYSQSVGAMKNGNPPYDLLQFVGTQQTRNFGHQWPGTDLQGNPVPSGVYTLKIWVDTPEVDYQLPLDPNNPQQHPYVLVASFSSEAEVEQNMGPPPISITVQ